MKFLASNQWIKPWYAVKFDKRNSYLKNNPKYLILQKQLTIQYEA